MIALKRFTLLFTLLITITLISVRCQNANTYIVKPIAKHSNGAYFVGSKTCIDCHSELFNFHEETAHFKTLSMPNDSTIMGSFSTENNRLSVNDSIYIKMEKKEGKYYQNSYSKKSNELLDTQLIDIVVGSGTRGQSFLQWRADSLVQLHASYFTASNSWIRSPGYTKGKLSNNRKVTARCLECHTTYIETDYKKKNTFNKNKLIAAVDCERCHGPAAEHVKYHNTNPDITEARAIKKIPSLTRQQQLDACALCHSGPRKLRSKPEFSFLTGDYLNKFSSPDFFSTHMDLDVHGNQYGMLKASQCFTKSEAMTCTTCHNPHKNERNKVSAFIKKCISCHNSSKTDCGLDMVSRSNNKNNCISCHMPKITSKAMFSENVITRDTSTVSMYSHFIAIYPNSKK